MSQPQKKAARAPTAQPSAADDTDKQLAALLGYDAPRLDMLARIMHARGDRFNDMRPTSVANLVKMLLTRAALPTNLAPLSDPFHLKPPAVAQRSDKPRGSQDDLEKASRSRAANPQPTPRVVDRPDEMTPAQAAIEHDARRRSVAPPPQTPAAIAPTPSAQQIAIEHAQRTRYAPPQVWPANPQPLTTEQQIEAARRRAAQPKGPPAQ